mmetsp:Transcript_55667/g.120249  ORF Transcript_55667/g.120249 Transcript_55667/m.120249 type:complete len:673 (-) Transcript_55667:57-2075(-)
MGQTCSGSRYSKDDSDSGRLLLPGLKAQNGSGQASQAMPEAAENYLRILSDVKIMDQLGLHHLYRLADALEVRWYEPDQEIIKQGEEGHEMFFILRGECSAVIRRGSDERELMVYTAGKHFGERCLITTEPRGATIRAKTDVKVLCLARETFIEIMGAQLQDTDYLTSDPRHLLVDFLRPGDSRGPFGSLVLRGLEMGESVTSWFAVFRPTSRDSIARQLTGSGVGKGLNVKGKSAKTGPLSGYVPFLQISDNGHKHKVELSPASARTVIFYSSREAREAARRDMEGILEDAHDLRIDDPSIYPVEKYEPTAYGLDLPEALVREAYIIRRDLSPQEGWETGRDSEPSFMDMNLHATRNLEEPRVVLVQTDTEIMNPWGLVVAYAEELVRPVVSDFDPFLLGSRGMEFEPLPEDVCKLAMWCLNHTEKILKDPDEYGWTTRWIDILHGELAKGFKVDIPRFGFGDPTTYGIISDMVGATASCGAVRHGAECFNFYFPQELDEEYLVIWEGFHGKGWKVLKEEDLRRYLIERVSEGFSFPLNPVWTVRDPGWHEVLEALQKSSHAQGPLSSWFPPSSGILEKIEAIHAACPEGFSHESDMEMDHDPSEKADLGLEKIRRQMILRRARSKLNAMRVMSGGSICRRLSRTASDLLGGPSTPSSRWDALMSQSPEQD